MDILHVGFNQDSSCFACGHTNGFCVYSCEPFKETMNRRFPNGGIGLVEMLFKCNIFAIVGGGQAPKYPPNQVMIWDDLQAKCIGELKFKSQVRAVRLRRDRIVVALEQKILVYNFADLKLVSQIETQCNTRGLVAISSQSESIVLACPGLHTGQVRVELYDRKQTRFIPAHNNALSALCLSMDGKRLATSSERGTLIRIWNTADTQLLQELRRGADSAIIYSLSLTRNCDWLAVSSDKGTIHVFSLDENVVTGAADASETPSGAPTSARQNPGSMLSVVKNIMPIPLPKYFASEWSFARFTVHEHNCKSVVGFGPEPHTLVVVTANGAFYKLSFDPVKGGLCTQDTYLKFTTKPEDEA